MPYAPRPDPGTIYELCFDALAVAYRDMALPWWRGWLWPSERQTLRVAALDMVRRCALKPPPPPAPPRTTDTGYIWHTGTR